MIYSFNNKCIKTPFNKKISRPKGLSEKEWNKFAQELIDFLNEERFGNFGKAKMSPLIKPLLCDKNKQNVGQIYDF